MKAKGAENPKVSFVIPCYKLAHLLGECIRSILAQSYKDFEILILDDASPDNAAEVAGSFDDARVQYIRNPTNLGNLENYNKGIHLSRGAYVWLISADDYLIEPDALGRFVATMDANPNVGYCFCPAIGVRGGKRVGVSGSFGDRDCIASGDAVLEKLFEHNFILAPSVLVRRTCYEQISVFPLEAKWHDVDVNMRWLGDWYLWCVFALAHDVAYFAQPMVCYREHELSMSQSITQKEIVQSCADSDLGMLWIVRQRAIEMGRNDVAASCLRGIANEYRRQATGKVFRASTYFISEPHFESSLSNSTDSEKEKRIIRTAAYQGFADMHVSQGQKTRAWRSYFKALRCNPFAIKIYVKLLLLPLGSLGSQLRAMARVRWAAASGPQKVDQVSG